MGNTGDFMMFMRKTNVDAKVPVASGEIHTNPYNYTSALTLSEGLVNRVSSLTQQSIELCLPGT